MEIKKLKFETGTHDTVLLDRKLLLDGIQDQVIYIRIPRTASTSISKMLRGEKPAWPHFYASLVRDLIGKEEYESTFTFTSVRNPWDRMVSWYLFYCNDFRACPDQAKTYKELGFKGWIMNGCPHLHTSPHHFAHWPEDPITQMNWITDESGKIIVDHIVKLETAQKDFESIRDKLGLKRLILPKINKSAKRQHKDYRKYYDWESKEKVREMYNDDVRYFRYEF
jgi:chondroitin 4-sulfotransferase 11